MTVPIVPTLDKRQQRTREALLGAFFTLVLERRYTEIKVADIVGRAGVGRSTFYEHFADKHAILAASIAQPFTPLADLVRDDAGTARVAAILAHFWQNRMLARALFAGIMRQKVTQVLVQMIEQRLDAARRAHPDRPALAPKLAAIQLAESLLAPIIAWLAGVAPSDCDTLARTLRATTTALLAAQRATR